MALIIGVSDFPEDTSITAIPNVLANVKQLKSILTNPELVGIPESNIFLSINENKNQIERKLSTIAEETRNRKNTLLIYYSGHGILSSTDYQLYLTTHYTNRRYLESDGINVESFKKYIRRSLAARKIVILDCCHSGAIIGSMGEIESKLQSELNQFEGTYVMTSSAQDEPSLYPVKSFDEPTYFTGKLINIVNEGLDIDQQFCSLRDIYNKIENDFRDAGLPRPQQSNFNSADQLIFARNKKYVERKPEDETAWENATKKNTKWGYVDFRRQYPSSRFAKQAKQKIFELEEEEHWNEALDKNTAFSYADYMDTYPDGKYTAEANMKLNELRVIDEQEEEERSWNQISKSNNLAYFLNFLEAYPNGRFAVRCQVEIDKIKEHETHRKRIEEQKRLEALEEQEAERRALEEQARIQIEKEKEEKIRIAAEQRRIAEEERRIAEEERRKKIEEEKQAQRRLLEEEDRKRIEKDKEEKRKKAEEEQRKKIERENEARRLAEEQNRLRIEQERLAEQRKREKAIQGYESKGDDRLKRRLYKDAISFYEQALSIEPNRPQSVKGIEECRKGIREQEKANELLKSKEIFIGEKEFGAGGIKMRNLVIVSVAAVFLLAGYFMFTRVGQKDPANDGIGNKDSAARISAPVRSSLSQADDLFRSRQYQKAINIYRAHESELSNEQKRNIAEIYENYPAEQNLPKAYYWFEKAARSGNVPAMVKLGDSYSGGVERVLRENHDSSFYWYKRAAINGDTAAMNQVSDMYRLGIGTRKNMDSARKWNRAASAAINEGKKQ